MRIPAALKWLVLGTTAWLVWRVPIVAHDFMLLSKTEQSHPIAHGSPASSSLPTSSVVMTTSWRERTISALRPSYAVRSNGKGELLLPLPPPAPMRPSAPAPDDGSATRHQSVSPGGMLADQGYARLRAGDRKAAAALLAQAVAASPGDPRAASWTADRRTLTRRWSGDAYLLARRGSGPALLGATPTLGGSQMGVRLAYNLNPLSDQRLTISGRIYQPISPHSGGTRAVQAVTGLELQPSRKLPVVAAIDRYIAIGESARNAWALRISGGMDDLPVAAAISASAYGQAGVIGIHSRDGYADGWGKLHTPVLERERFHVRAGAGVWGGAQPGASRLDIGPSVEIKGAMGRANLRGSIDYRVRAAGNAAPGNGPAFTIQAGF